MSLLPGTADPARSPHSTVRTPPTRDEVPAAQKQHCAGFMTPRADVAISSVITGQYPPAPAARAYDMLDARQYHGKVVVRAAGRPS